MITRMTFGHSGSIDYPAGDIDDPGVNRSVHLVEGDPIAIPDAWPVGEGHVVAGKLYQPCFHVVGDFVDVDVAVIDLSDDNSVSWLPGARPDAATVAGNINVAQYGPGDDHRGPWGFAGNAGWGAEFLDSFVAGGLLVLQLHRANQLYAVKLDGTGKAWSKQGWANYPTWMASRSQAGLETDVPALSDPSAIDYWRDYYTALGVVGDKLVIEREREYLSPGISPAFRSELRWEISGLDICTGASYHYACKGGFLAKWFLAQVDGGVTSVPEINWTSSPFFGVFSTLGYPPGNPNHASRSVDYPFEDVWQECLDDALELAERLAYYGHFVYDHHRYIEVLDLASGNIVASREQEHRVQLPGVNLQGPGTAELVEYSYEDVEGWPIHPDMDYWRDRVPFFADRSMLYPPPTPKPGYSGGSWDVRSDGPQIGLALSAGGVREFCDGAVSKNVASCYSMSAGGSAITGGQAPPGIYVLQNQNGDLVFGDATPERFGVISCYSKIAGGAKGKTTWALPWPFDPLSMATDGEHIYFAPSDDLTGRLSYTQQGAAIPVNPDNHTLPDWEDEIARIKRVVCWDADLEDVWEVDVLDHVTKGSLPLSGQPHTHPCSGDRIGNQILLGDTLVMIASGAEGQRLLEIDRADGEVLRSIVLAPTAMYSVADQPNHTPALLCGLSKDPWCRDSLMALGNQLYGLKDKIWKLS